ncbi:putative Type I restriction-modification system specificity subunit S [Vibrio coralliirubri]|uniref:restriction endonuclease subunit S n=1 Tax=Vibrio coralliirubri TaxID=1516159 RepID=UPI000638567B|nr:restriction endonuclease subunit S [Vibrio coralliirubri]CDU07371.1 putative Type I restriction-modification system specificity subunit S [Vibrio coralliirubri]
MTEQMNVPKLRFGGFSGGLLVTRLSEIINKLESGVSVNSEDVPPNSNENGILKTSAIYAGSFNPEQAKVITDSSELQRAKLNPKKDSIIISRMNTPTLVGESGYISKDYPNLFIPDRLWQATVSSQHCARWLSFLLTSPRTRFIISSKGTGTSNSMKNISKPSFLSIDAVTPTLLEQQKIASFLSKVDEKIGLLSEKKDKLTEYKRGVMQQLFNGEWHEQDGQLTFVPPTLRFKADDGSEFPDWEEKTLIELAAQGLSNGVFNDPKRIGKGYRLINVKDMYSGNFIDTSTLSLLDLNEKEFSKNQVKYGDIFFTRSSLVPSGIAYSNVNLSNDDDITYDGHLIKFSPKLDMMSPYYFANYLRSYSSRKSFISRGKQSTMTTIGQEDIKDISFLIPSLDEQTKIADLLLALDQKIDFTNSELENAKEWKKGLLQQMFV